ncbi:MAG: cytochrome c [Cytophagaceae bacterium]|nr:cytochrome c [Cytophagaceae bacterium]
MKKLLTIFSILFFVVACTKVVMPVATENDAKRASEKWPNTTLADLTQGKSLYEQHCAGCHKLYKPDSHNEAQWNKIVPPMANKAKIDSEKENLILKYLVTMSASRN